MNQNQAVRCVSCGRLAARPTRLVFSQSEARLAEGVERLDYKDPE